MNKLFTKIVGTCLGLAMAVGTGVAVAAGTSKKALEVKADTTYDISSTAASSITAGHYYVIGAATSSSNSTVKYLTGISGSWGTASTESYLLFTAESIANGFAFSSSSGYLTPRTGTSNTFSAFSESQPSTPIILLSGAVATYSTEYPLRLNGNSGYRWYGKEGTTGTAAYLYEATESTSTDCTVTYNANGGTGTMTDSNSPYTVGSNVTVLTNTFTAPTGFEFSGWNTKADGTGTSYSNGATISSISSGVTLYAQWSEIADSYLHDVLQVSDFSATSTSYVQTSNISADESTAVYCGQTAKGNGVIQLNASYGIGTSSTGGLLRKIKVVWDSHTASGRSLNVKGSTSAYTANTCTSGTSIGTISYSSDFLTTIVLFDSTTYYPYISISGVGGALYLESIDFGFEPVYPTSITVAGDSSVYVGNTITLTATPVHSSGWSMTDATYAWSSSNTGVATVSNAGVVTGVSEGSATIYATSNGDNTIVGSKVITVSNVPTYFIELSLETDTGTNYGYVGDGVYVYVDSSNLAGNINWTVSGGTISNQLSDNDSFAGNLASAGTITITATDSGDNTNTASVTVNSIASLNAVNVPNVSTKTWTASKAADFGAAIDSVNGTDSGTLTFDDDSTMSYERTLDYLASGKSDYLGYSSPYIQFGSSNALESLVLTTSSSISNVTKVVVNCGSKSGDSTVTVTVGGNAFDTAKAAPDSKTNVEFDGSASGVVEITMAKSTKTSGCAQYIASVAITYSDGTSVNIANASSYHLAQSAVIEYAESFNSTLSAICVAYGSTDTDDLSDAWSSLSSTFTSWFVNTGKSLTGEQKERALLLFANADSVELDEDHPNADALQQMLAKYDWIVGHYNNLSDFLHSTADRAEVANANGRIIGLPIFNSSNGASISVIIIVSLVGLTAIGGYFFIRKRKEQ